MKNEFRDKPEVYTEFLDMVKSFKVKTRLGVPNSGGCIVSTLSIMPVHLLGTTGTGYDISPDSSPILNRTGALNGRFLGLAHTGTIGSSPL